MIKNARYQSTIEFWHPTGFSEGPTHQQGHRHRLAPPNQGTPPSPPSVSLKTCALCGVQTRHRGESSRLAAGASAPHPRVSLPRVEHKLSAVQAASVVEPPFLTGAGPADAIDPAGRRDQQAARWPAGHEFTCALRRRVRGERSVRSRADTPYSYSQVVISRIGSRSETGARRGAAASVVASAAPAAGCASRHRDWTRT